MTERQNRPPESPTEIAMQTGMEDAGWANVRGTLEEALIFPPGRIGGEGRTGALHGTPNAAAPDELDVIPGQSGAEGLADLPGAGPDDPRDGP